jgi:hypothetical protein
MATPRRSKMSDEQGSEPEHPLWFTIVAVLLAVLLAPLILAWIFLGGGNLKVED